MESIDLAISFDTTGSMYPCLAEVRRKIVHMTDVLFSAVPGLRIAIIAHGDYCDTDTYVTKILDFSTDKNKIQSFVKNIGATYGGDFPECYELVLRKARTELNWLSGKSKVLVMIGDATPHEVSYYDNTNNIDWQNETGLFKEAGIQIYGCHAMPGIRSISTSFYKALANNTNGHYLTLDQFSAIPDLLMAVCYKQFSGNKFENFVNEIDTHGRMTRGLRVSFINMGATIDDDGTGIIASGMSPVLSGRFQVFTIDSKQDIRSFVNEQGIAFKPGRGFYQLTKSVKVQQYKEIILVHKRNNDIYNGSDVREMLGLLPQTSSGGTTQRLSSKNLLADYDIFIQSTSYNRVLLPGTRFMYEIEDWDIHDIKKVSSKPKKKVSSKPKKNINIPKTLLKAKKAYDARMNNPNREWVLIAQDVGYSSGSTASRAAKKIIPYTKVDLP